MTDKYGTVQADYSYDVFGNPYLGNLENDIGFGYCGKVYDIGTGLYDYGFRDYSPVSARFTTVDPIRDGANWFSYVVNDPVNYYDPLGLRATDGGNKSPTFKSYMYGMNIGYSKPNLNIDITKLNSGTVNGMTASTATVNVPNVYGRINPNDVKGKFVFIEVSKSKGTINVYVSGYEDTHQVNQVASFSVITNVQRDTIDNKKSSDISRHQKNGTNPTQVPNGIYEITDEKAPADANNRYGKPGHGLYVNVQQDLKVTDKKSEKFGEFVKDDGYEFHITPLTFTNGCIGVYYDESSKESKERAEYIQDYLNFLYRDMKSSGGKTYVEYKD